MYDVIVIGAGLFGSVIAAAFRKQGRKVLVIDDAKPNNGSKPAACLMKPGWFAALGREIYEPSLKLLDTLYGVQDLKFKTAIGSVVVHWCNPFSILQGANVVSTVRKITTYRGNWQVDVSGQIEIGKCVVVAAGIWSVALVPVDRGLVGQAGMACLWPNERIEQPFVKVWAPYKQISAFNRGDGLWVGDSNSIRMDKWSSIYARATEQRCSKAAGMVTAPTQLFGVRPYSKMKPCYLKETRPGLWVATGGAKNGTLAAGWCASELVRRVV